MRPCLGGAGRQFVAQFFGLALQLLELAFLDLGFQMVGAEVFEATESALELADAYQAYGILTPKFYDDGLHIAVATVGEADVLVSWNFKHIVHFDKIRMFNAVNLEYGYKPLQIFSPREVTSYGRAKN